MTVAEGLSKIGAAFLSTREVSSQECIYRCMPELWLRKIFSGTVFISTALAEKRICSKVSAELEDLGDDSTDITLLSAMVSEQTSIDRLCLAEVAGYY